ncbi:hypothetical protein [Hymenobacter crusticola]|uniref:Intracellular proteinase inhibitor BsuPI domain-containing protein n=1 Tax=Hymenobacter crusticola TaxID=1770526 RepID=A0A243W9Q6_9BACT|nr:hypothetical protein [Hymenobacter crusticola]OUJ72278.1 hypothetical protein BXP70_18625 [Hymenobacter crusticola]
MNAYFEECTMQRIALLLVLYYLSFGMTSSQVKQDTDKMSLVVKSAEKEFSNDCLFITLEFKNTSNKTIRLPEFNYKQMKILYFTSVLVQNERGRIVAVKPGPPKFEFVEAPGETTYIEIPKNQSYRRTINLKGYLWHGKSKLEPGLYRINSHYWNWYGGECIKGAFHSNELLLRIKK